MAITFDPIAKIVAKNNIANELESTANAAVIDAIPVPNIIKATEIPMEFTFSFSMILLMICIGFHSTDFLWTIGCEIVVFIIIGVYTTKLFRMENLVYDLNHKVKNIQS